MRVCTHNMPYMLSTCRKVRNGTFVVRNVVRWQRRLDFHISSVVKRPLDKLAPELHVILRLGVFEHLFSNSPAYTVKQQVQLTNALLNPGAGKMTNGEPHYVCMSLLFVLFAPTSPFSRPFFRLFPRLPSLPSSLPPVLPPPGISQPRL